ncbi:MAG: hypothetical protein ACOYM3_29080 [Terrimicrobiaceae bacterium]
MNENEDTSEITPPQAPVSTNDTSGSDSPPPSPPPPANPSKESPGKASKAATNAGKPDAKKKCKVRFDVEVSENQLEIVFRGTLFSKATASQKLAMLRLVLEQLKAADFRDLLLKSLSPGGERPAEGGEPGGEQ